MIGYTTFMKHAEKMTKKASKARPILTGVHHAENGDMIVTDAHRLYLAKGAQSQRDNSVICPTTGSKIDGTFPDVHRLIPADNDKMSVTLDVPTALKAAKALKSCGQVNEKLPIFDLEVTENGTAYLAVKTTDIEAKYIIGATEINEKHNLHFNSQYLIEALELFKDAGYPRVILTTYGGMRPFTLSFDDGLLALILPIRKY